MKVLLNVYYSPEQSGLKIFEQIDTAESYEFNIFVIFQKISDNRLFYATDAGCSCPTPFEDISEISEITNETFYNFEKALENHYNLSKDDFVRIRTKVKNYLKTVERGLVNNAREFFY